MSKKLPSFRLTIMGLDWEVYLQSDSAYKKMHGNDSSGVTYPHDREMYFNKSFYTPEIIRHELFHAYHASSPNGSSNLTADQIEDQGCEIFEKYGPLMLHQSDQILSFFSRKHVLK
jgi:hypothetical protein